MTAGRRLMTLAGGGKRGGPANAPGNPGSGERYHACLAAVLAQLTNPASVSGLLI